MNISSFIKGDNTLTPTRKKQREVLMYIIFGVLTTLVSMITFFLIDLAFENYSLEILFFSYPVDILMLINQTISWIAAVSFAFLTNRAWVFCSKGPFFKEMLSFFSARIATLILFELLVFSFLIFILENGFGISNNSLFISIIGLDFKWNFVVKLINSVFVMVSNYFFSKWFIFKKVNVVEEMPVSVAGGHGNPGNDDV
jgi:putative flippase GtrA